MASSAASTMRRATTSWRRASFASGRFHGPLPMKSEITTTRPRRRGHGHGIQHAGQVRGGRDRPRVPLELVADAQCLCPAVPVRTTLAAAPS